jgi:hypothetical protein
VISSAAEGVRRRDELERAIRSHKAAIRRHRQELGRAKAALLELERECALRGIKLVVTGEGGSPWPTKAPNQSST